MEKIEIKKLGKAKIVVCDISKPSIRRPNSYDYPENNFKSCSSKPLFWVSVDGILLAVTEMEASSPKAFTLTDPYTGMSVIKSGGFRKPGGWVKAMKERLDSLDCKKEGDFKANYNRAVNRLYKTHINYTVTNYIATQL